PPLPPRPILLGAISWSTTRIPTQTNLPNRRCPIQEQRLTRGAPRSQRCLSLHIGLTPRSQRCLSLRISLMPRSQRCLSLRMSLMPRSQCCLSLRMSLTRACSRWAKFSRGKCANLNNGHDVKTFTKSEEVSNLEQSHRCGNSTIAICFNAAVLCEVGQPFE